MKTRNNWPLYFLIVLLSACTATDVDIKDNPNAATPDQADKRRFKGTSILG